MLRLSPRLVVAIGVASWWVLDRLVGHETLLVIKRQACGRDTGRESGPSKVLMIFMRPPQHGHGGGSWSEFAGTVVVVVIAVSSARVAH